MAVPLSILDLSPVVAGGSVAESLQARSLPPTYGRARHVSGHSPPRRARRDGGERLHPPGWTEISAVCTDEAYRGQGLASRLVSAVAAGIRRRGETPFMHAAATNVNAIRLYLSLGYELRRHTTFAQVRVPG